MSNIVTTIPVTRPSHSSARQGEQVPTDGQDDTPDEPQVTVSLANADEPLLAD